ncbi:MAG TPA: TetR/AcrR family transcriptional regulator [Amycolatopsis sp.]|nr:TetR/AcrR family transcriptional regulator [Amycolatopsis sp.]
MSVGPNSGDKRVNYGPRAARTRAAILDAARELFLDHGYAGTQVAHITRACGISRAGFYTYFRDKHEVFLLLADKSYRAVLEVVGRWHTLPHSCTPGEIAGWVRAYFDFLDVHGAFIFASIQSGPDDARLVASSRRRQARVAYQLGAHLRERQARPARTPEALGLATMAMLDRCWQAHHAQRVPIEADDVIETIAGLISGILTAKPLVQSK